MLCFSSSMLPVSLDCQFLIVFSVFSNVYTVVQNDFNIRLYPRNLMLILWVSLLEQSLLSLLDALCSLSSICSAVRSAHTLLACVVFC